MSADEDADAFVDRLGGVAEGSPWVAERAWALGPFADADASPRPSRARSRARRPPDEQLALIRAHPDLAGRAALAGELTRRLGAASRRPPASTG